AGLAVGQAINGTGVPVGTYITGLTGTVATLSNNLTAAFAGNYTASNSIGGTGIITPTSITAFVPQGQAGYITGTIAGTGAITKSGQGTLFLTGNTTFAPNTTSTFSGGVTLTEGTLTLGANTVVDANNNVLSGPLGTGTLTIQPSSFYTTLDATQSFTQYYGGQTTLIQRTIANPVVVKGDFQFGGSNNLSFTGSATFEGSDRIISANGNALKFHGPISGTANISKVGAGSLVFYGDTSAWSGNWTVLNQTGGWLFLNTQAFNNHSVTLYQGGNLVLHALGDNTSNPERITTAGTIISPGNADYNLWVQAQYSDLMPIRAANKTIALTTPIAFAGQTVTLDNAASQGGLGLELAGPITLNGGVRFSISQDTHVSNRVQGLTFSGLVSGTGDIVKDGNGSLVLTNPNNTFRGNLIAAGGGYIAATSDAALGDPAN
ncbi:MAG: hypothetical protein EBS87_12240, partial [Sphingomonadaceae bacterium]|nr:hypothetical protein [Sphingomonadaceae bacterium]